VGCVPFPRDVWVASGDAHCGSVEGFLTDCSPFRIACSSVRKRALISAFSARRVSYVSSAGPVACDTVIACVLRPEKAHGVPRDAQLWHGCVRSHLSFFRRQLSQDTGSWRGREVRSGGMSRADTYSMGRSAAHAQTSCPAWFRELPTATTTATIHVQQARAIACMTAQRFRAILMMNGTSS